MFSCIVSFRQVAPVRNATVNQSKTYLDTPPSLVPIPALDSHIVRTSQHERQRRVHNETSDIVGVRLERGDLFAGGDVVDAELKVVRARYELYVMSARSSLHHRQDERIPGDGCRVNTRCEARYHTARRLMSPVPSLATLHARSL